MDSRRFTQGLLVAALSIAFVSPALFSGAPTAQAAGEYPSSESGWTGWIPSAAYAPLTQTLSNLVVDDSVGAEVVLTANLAAIGTGATANLRQLHLTTALAADSRRGIGFTIGYGSSNDFNMIVGALPYSLRLAENAGVRISLPQPIWYYGVWYHSIWVVENGYVILDPRAVNDHGGKYTSPFPPTVIPAHDDGRADSFVAPFWTRLTRGTIRHGPYSIGMGTPGYAIAWTDMRDYLGNRYNFLVLFTTLTMQGSAQIRFEYGAMGPTNGGGFAAGIENQLGTKGFSVIHTEVASLARIIIVPLLQSYSGILDVKVIVEKYADLGGGCSAPSSDPEAEVLIYGQRGAGAETYPGGMNVDLYSPEDEEYLHQDYTEVLEWGADQIIDESVQVGLSFLGPFGVPFQDAYDFYDEAYGFVEMLSETTHGSPAILHNSAFGDASPAYTLNRANEENLAELDLLDNYVWEVEVAPSFQWTLDLADIYSTGACGHHYLVVRAEVTVVNSWTGMSKKVTTPPIQINLQMSWPSGQLRTVETLGRTNPDGHYYNSYWIDTPYGPGFHIDSAGSADAFYDMLGWMPLTADRLDNFRVSPDGKLRVTGWFRQSDTLPDYMQRDGRVANLYVIDSTYLRDGLVFNDKLNNIVKTVPLLSSADGTAWTKKDVVINMGLSYAGKDVKIGIGRYDKWTVDYSLALEWAGVTVSPPNVLLYLGAVGPGTTDPPPGTYDYPSGPQTISVTALPHTGSIFRYWILDGVSRTDNPILVTMDRDHLLTAYFGYRLEIKVSPTSPIPGTTRPAPGVYWHTPGTSVSVTAIPDSNYIFSYWILDGVKKTKNPITVVMDSDHMLTAYFRSWGCVAEGTLVTMADRSVAPVEDLRPGDKVLGYDLESGTLVEETIQSTFKAKVSAILSINEDALRVTLMTQPIYVRDATGTKWVYDPFEIQMGWELFDPLHQRWTLVSTTVVVSETTWVYDFITDGPRTYLANSFLVLDKPIP